MSAIDKLLIWAKINCPDVYDEYVLESYEEKNGQHFDEAHARKAVSCMYHRDNGEIIKGERWTIDQVRNATENMQVGDYDTCWDKYVALHIWWHDLGRNYTQHGLSDTELIEDAIEFYFHDDDAVEGKVWRYINHM